jgi:hypothetical protein
VWHHKYALNVSCFEIVLRYIHLILALDKLFLNPDVVLLLFDRLHHVDEISEEGLGAIKSECFFCLSFFVLRRGLFRFFSLFPFSLFLLFFLFSFVSLIVFLFLDFLIVGDRHAFEIPDREYNKNMPFHELLDLFDERGDDLSIAVEFVDASEVF